MGSPQAMSVLLIHENPQVSELFLTNIFVYTNQKVISASNIQEAKKILNNLSDIEIIVTEKKSGGKEIFEKVYQLSKTFEQDYYIISLGQVDYIEHYKDVVAIDKNDVKSLVNIVGDRLGITPGKMVNLKVPQFFPFKRSLFIPNVIQPVDVFQIKHYLFEKVIDKGKILTEEKSKELDEQEVKYLYIDHFDRLKFLERATANLVAALNGNELSLNQRVNMTLSGFQLVQELTRELKIDDKVIELVESSMRSMERILEKCGALSSLYKTLVTHNTTYKFLHVMMSLYVGTSAAHSAEYGGKELLKKLCFLCFFADVAISKDELVRINSRDELERADLSSEDYDQVIAHASNAAKLVAKFKNFPMDMHVHIKHHHGNQKGVGFKVDIYNISTPVFLYMMSSHFAHKVIHSLESGVAFNKDELMTELKERFSMNNRFNDFIYWFKNL